MQWTTELSEEWDEVPDDPPVVDSAQLEMNWVEEGFVLAAEPADSDSISEERAVFSTVACKVGNETATRDPNRAGPAESADL